MKKIFFIDWGVCYITDFRLDLGYTLMQINLDDARTTTRDEYLRLYEHFGSVKVKPIEFFELLALIKNLMIYTILKSEETGFHNSNEIRSFIIASKSFKLLLELSQSNFLELTEIFNSLELT
ncbi:MAG: hypothetical protein ACXAC2_02470 [Candidatus Kariarchaeaceae archaeon]